MFKWYAAMVNYTTNYYFINIHFNSVISTNYASMALLIVVVLLAYDSHIWLHLIIEVSSYYNANVSHIYVGVCRRSLMHTNETHIYAHTHTPAFNHLKKELANRHSDDIKRTYRYVYNNCYLVGKSVILMYNN